MHSTKVSRKRSESPMRESLAKRQKSTSSSSDNPSSSLNKSIDYRDFPDVLSSSPDSHPSESADLVASSPTNPSVTAGNIGVSEDGAVTDLALADLEVKDAFAAYGIVELSVKEPDPPVQKPRLDTLPPKVLEKIFTFVFQPSWRVPGYVQGMLRWGIHSAMENDQDVCTEPNVDVRPLFINKVLHETAIATFYGANKFFLGESEKSWWWLKRIGDHNIARLRTVQLRLNSGWWYDRFHGARAEHSAVSDCSAEETWYKVVSRLQQHARLDALYIELDEWHRNPATWGPRAQQVHDDLNMWRKLTVDRLFRFRNMKDANVAQRKGRWLSRVDESNLRFCMMQKSKDSAAAGSRRSGSVAQEPRRKVGLGELMEAIRIDHMQRRHVYRRGGWIEDQVT